MCRELKRVPLDFNQKIFEVWEGYVCYAETDEEAERWKPEEPPTGEGYQIWETTSEGSPMTPVFESLDELCAWAETNISAFGDTKISKDEWVQLLTGEEGFYFDMGNTRFI